MLPKLLNNSLRDFLNDLAAKKPVPGGGSTAALAGALGAALSAMAANYSYGRQGAKADARLKELVKKNEAILKNLARLVDEDGRVFRKLQASRKVSDIAYQQAILAAADVPFRVCGLCGEAMALAREISGLAIRPLLTDSGCSACLIGSAFSAAALNVRINLVYLKDRRLAGRVGKELRQMAVKIGRHKQQILKIVENYLENGTTAAR